MATEQGPLLSLRIRSSRSSPPSKQEQDDVVDRIGIMLKQEKSTYACQDYLLRRKLETMDNETVCSDDCPELVNEVDTLCREKMCEWSYRVIDHFHASREIVTIAFAYLDRFVDLCSCDRNAFKLAAMTCLYMATKLFNAREISMRSLAELSRGEFDMAHIAEMEVIILKTLSWRLNPPTPQCFVNALYGLLPTASTPVTRAICQRATFFAELSLFDYCFVTQPRSAIALAALLNAMEGMDETVVSKQDQLKFVKTLRETVRLEHSEEKVEFIRNRLWYIYSQSVQYQADSEDFGPTQVSEAPVKNLTIKGAPSEGELSQSPVSVRER
jgi:lipoyl(octanoyl) transferase